MNTLRRLFLVPFCTVALYLYAPAQNHDTRNCGFITAGKLKIYYCEQGRGTPVILLHAGFLDMQQWNQQVSLLAREHRVITMDLPGHGRSQGVDTTTRISEVIRLLMKKLQVERASFVGMSLGAACVLDFAISYPAKTIKLLLCSPGLNGWQDVMQLDTLSNRLFLRTDTFTDTHDPELITENFVHLWLDGPFRKTAPVDSVVREYVFRTASQKVQNRNSRGPLFDKKKAAKRVHLIHKPVMILYGNLDIPFIVQVSRFLHQNIQGSQLHIINGTAHFISLENPGLFNQYLNNWLK